MGFIVFEEEAFNYLDAQLENFVKRMDWIRERSEDKTMNKWLDTQDVSDAQHLPTDSADASGKRNFGLYANQPQDLLQAGGRDGYRSSSGGQEKGHALSQAHRLGCQYTTATLSNAASKLSNVSINNKTRQLWAMK